MMPCISRYSMPARIYLLFFSFALCTANALAQGKPSPPARTATPDPASLPALAVRSVKRAARTGLERDFASGLELEQELFASLAGRRDRPDAGAELRDKSELMGTETK